MSNQLKVVIGRPEVTIVVDATGDPEIDDNLVDYLNKRTPGVYAASREKAENNTYTYFVIFDIQASSKSSISVAVLIRAIESYFLSYGKDPIIIVGN